MNILVALPIAPAVPTVAPALPAGHDVAPPIAPDHRSHPDAELFELVEQFIAADRKYRELSACVDRMEADVIYARDPLPDVLRWRKSDLKLGLPILYNCPAIPKPNWDAPIQVNQIRTKKWIRVEREMIKGHPIKGMFNERTPSKAPRARADEIIAAFDEWDKDRTPPRGYKEAARECTKADDVAFRLEERILKTRAKTIDGMFAKIRVAHARGEWRWNELPPVEKLEKLDLAQISGCGDEVAARDGRNLHS